MRLLVLLALLLLPDALAAQGFRTYSGRNHPEITWRVAETEHFEIVYPERLAGIEAEAAAVAEETYAALSENLGVTFDRPIRVYLSDEDEIANGFAFSVGPAGFTNIWVHVNETAEVWTGDVKWLRKVMAHEIAHIFHYRAIRSPIGLLQNVFANPIPSFWAEGVAQYLTEEWDAQRGDRWLRTAVFEDRLSYSDGLSAWNGRLRYAVGNSQVRYLAEQYGDSTLTSILRHRKTFLPGIKVHDFYSAFEATLEKPYRDFYEEWRKHVNVYYNTLAGQMERVDSLGTPLAIPGTYLYDVAYSPDTSLVAALVLSSVARPVRRLAVIEGMTDSTVARRVRVLAERVEAGLVRRLVLKLAVWFTRQSTGMRLTDAHNGLRVIRRDVVLAGDILDHVEEQWRALLAGVEVRVVFEHRDGGDDRVERGGALLDGAVPGAEGPRCVFGIYSVFWFTPFFSPCGDGSDGWSSVDSRVRTRGGAHAQGIDAAVGRLAARRGPAVPGEVMHALAALGLTGPTTSAQLGLDWKFHNRPLLQMHGSLRLVRERSTLEALGFRLSDQEFDVVDAGFVLRHVDRRSRGVNLVQANVRHALADRSADPDLVTPARDSDWTLLRVSLARMQYLTPSQRLFARLYGQYTSDVLVPMEQISLGGPDSIRSLAVSEALGDRGYQATLEYQVDAPGFGDVASPFGGRPWRELLQFELFVDHGRVSASEGGLSPAQARSYSGAGAGLRFRLPHLSGLDLRLAAAVPVGGADPSDGDDLRTWVRLAMTF